jgi:hypothetical protein
VSTTSLLQTAINDMSDDNDKSLKMANYYAESMGNAGCGLTCSEREL